MGRKYVVPFSIAATTAVDLVEINPSSTNPVELCEIVVEQSSDTDSEELAVQVIRSHSTSGSGGAAATPRPLDGGDSAFAGTAETGNTTVATGGSPITVEERGFNVLSGLSIVYPPGERPKCVASGRIVVTMPSTPADSLTFKGKCVFEEL